MNYYGTSGALNGSSGIGTTSVAHVDKREPAVPEGLNGVLSRLNALHETLSALETRLLSVRTIRPSAVEKGGGADVPPSTVMDYLRLMAHTTDQAIVRIQALMGELEV